MQRGIGNSVLLFGWLLLVSGVSLLTPITAKADVQDVTAIANPAALQVGETFVYRISVSGTGSLPSPTVNLPSAFQILTGPNTNMNMQFVNGRMSSERILTYTLRAMRQGDHVIPAPEVKVRGKVIKGNPVTIQVSSPGSSSPPGTSAPPAATTRGTPVPPEPVPSPSGQQDDIFLQVDVQPREAVFQQPIVVTWTLYFQPSVRTYDVRRLASTEGFWSEEWEVSNPPDVVQRTISGETYNAAVLHRLILFPTKTGKLTIGPMEIVLQVEGGRKRSIFDDFFNDPFFSGGLQEREISSKPVTISVKSLPEQGQPQHFDNLVGDWKIEAELDQDTVRVNDSVLLTVTISGSGNVGFVPTPEVSVPADIERYEPELETSKHPGGGTLRGEKKFKYLLIPRRVGSQQIPAISFNYYDPKAKKYFTLSTRPLTLQVMPATGWTGSGEEQIPGGAPSRVETVGTDIRWIVDTGKGLKQIGPPITERFSYWLTYLVPVLVALAGFVIRGLRQHEAGRESERRSRRAARSAMNALKQARGQHASGEIESGYTALARGLISYLADRIGVPVAQLDEPLRRSELASRGLNEELIGELEEILGRCNTARFTPQGADPHALGELIEGGRTWIMTADRPLGGGR
ncbi:MAG: BatD family protein [bacterium]